MINAEQKILSPKNDIVFQTLFTKGKEKITKALLQDILKIKIDELELDKSKELLNDNIEDKNGRIDLRAVLNGNIECDIEIQLKTHKKMKERFLYYWAKMYTSNLKIGNDYDKLRKTISIIIVGEKINEFNHINKPHTKWKIIEENKKDVLTQDLEIHIIELPKAIQEYKICPQDELLQWMMFLENPEDAEVTKIMENNENIREAKEELEKISRDDLLRRMALKAEIERLDRNQFEKEAREEGLEKGLKEGRERGMREGKEKGIKEGIKEGIREGIKQEREKNKKEKIEMAKKLLKAGMSKEQVCEITNLELKEIEGN